MCGSGEQGRSGAEPAQAKQGGPEDKQPIQGSHQAPEGQMGGQNWADGGPQVQVSPMLICKPALKLLCGHSFGAGKLGS